SPSCLNQSLSVLHEHAAWWPWSLLKFLLHPIHSLLFCQERAKFAGAWFAIRVDEAQISVPPSLWVNLLHPPFRTLRVPVCVFPFESISHGSPSAIKG